MQPYPLTKNQPKLSFCQLVASGWTDQSIKTCGRFYPPWVQTSEQRLKVYSQTFPCVEVDSSTYAIPSPSNTAKWAAQTPDGEEKGSGAKDFLDISSLDRASEHLLHSGFKFHFKIFGLFTHRSASVGTLPRQVRKEGSNKCHEPIPFVYLWPLPPLFTDAPSHPATLQSKPNCPARSPWARRRAEGVGDLAQGAAASHRSREDGMCRLSGACQAMLCMELILSSFIVPS